MITKVLRPGLVILALLLSLIAIGPAAGSSLWNEDPWLSSSSTLAFDEFGRAVDISGNNALVGAPNADGSAAGDAGAAYMFRYDGSQWPEQGWLTASDGLEGDEFGSAVATDGRLALVGAPFADVPGGFNPGAAYVYRWDGSQWVEQAKLTASDSASLDNWGRSVALHGLTALVGGPQATVDGKFDAGAVYVWQWDGTEWVEQAKLIASDGEQGDQFGWSVALSGNTALVGARSDEVGGNLFAGSAYIFRRSGGVWSEQANLTASDAVSFDWFGESVAISGNTALVGAWMDDFDGKIDAGSAYAYGWDGSQWVEQAKLTASDGETDDWVRTFCVRQRQHRPSWSLCGRQYR